jgi:hypothetical protein
MGEKQALPHVILSGRYATGDSAMTDYASDLSSHRIKKAKDLLRQAELLLKNNEYDGSVNRSYFAIFHAIRALLALVGLDSRKHTGVISYFDQYFVKTGICEKQQSMIAHTAFDSRQLQDYQDFQEITAEQAQTQFNDATRFVLEIKQQQVLLIQGKTVLPKIP